MLIKRKLTDFLLISVSVTSFASQIYSKSHIMRKLLEDYFHILSFWRNLDNKPLLYLQ